PRVLGVLSAVDVDDTLTRVRDHARRLGQQVDARRVPIARVVRRKVSADVAQTGGAQDGGDHRLSEDVGGRVAVEAGRMIDAHAADHERPALAQGVQVVADTDPQVEETASCSLMRASTTAKSSGVVNLIFAGSPWTTVTA